MKKIIFSLLVLFVVFTNAQTKTELLGKWQLIRWVQNGKEKDIASTFHTDQVYQVFNDDNTFESINGNEVHNGKWKLSNDATNLTITTTIMPIKFTIDYFDAKKRITTYKGLGTFTYKKIEEIK
jgi:hypothetical protein